MILIVEKSKEKEFKEKYKNIIESNDFFVRYMEDHVVDGFFRVEKKLEEVDRIRTEIKKKTSKSI